jgi:hypothetical protein
LRRATRLTCKRSLLPRGTKGSHTGSSQSRRSVPHKCHVTGNSQPPYCRGIARQLSKCEKNNRPRRRLAVTRSAFRSGAYRGVGPTCSHRAVSPPQATCGPPAEFATKFFERILGKQWQTLCRGAKWGPRGQPAQERRLFQPLRLGGGGEGRLPGNGQCANPHRGWCASTRCQPPQGASPSAGLAVRLPGSAHQTTPMRRSGRIKPAARHDPLRRLVAVMLGSTRMTLSRPCPAGLLLDAISRDWRMPVATRC